MAAYMAETRVLLGVKGSFPNPHTPNMDKVKITDRSPNEMELGRYKSGTTGLTQGKGTGQKIVIPILAFFTLTHL